jgi:hypothetical protein
MTTSAMGPPVWFAENTRERIGRGNLKCVPDLIQTSASGKNRRSDDRGCRTRIRIRRAIKVEFEIPGPAGNPLQKLCCPERTSALLG